MSREFLQKSQIAKIIKAKLKKIITLVVDFYSSTTYLQSQKFLALVTTLKYFFQSVRKILSGPCIYLLKYSSTRVFWVWQWIEFDGEATVLEIWMSVEYFYCHYSQVHSDRVQKYYQVAVCGSNRFVLKPYTFDRTECKKRKLRKHQQNISKNVK